jgi:hypothetical protein
VAVITLQQYWTGRDEAFPEDCTLAVRRNAAALLAAVNTLLKCAAEDRVAPGIDEHTWNQVASGWRPPSVNARTSNAGKHSTHITGQGVDLQDHADRRLARWCLRNLDRLEGLGLYMEDPRWTPSWLHLQCVPPASGKRVYIPSSAPALALALPEQQTA